MRARDQDVTTSLGLLVLRLAFGGYMMTHGYGKLLQVLAGEFDKFPDPIGLGVEVSLVLTMLAEFVCALLVVLGLGTRFVASPVVFAMAVAAFVVHANDPWTMTRDSNGKEPALLYLAAYLTLIFTGAGKFSLDAVFWRRKGENS